MCLGKGADLHMAQFMPLPLTISWVGFTFWCWLTRVVLDKIQEGRKMVVRVCVCVCVCVCVVNPNPKFVTIHNR